MNCALYHYKVLSSTVRSEILFPVLKLSPLFPATANVPFAYSAHWVLFCDPFEALLANRQVCPVRICRPNRHTASYLSCLFSLLHLAFVLYVTIWLVCWLLTDLSVFCYITFREFRQIVHFESFSVKRKQTLSYAFKFGR